MDTPIEHVITDDDLKDLELLLRIVPYGGEPRERLGKLAGVLRARVALEAEAKRIYEGKLSPCQCSACRSKRGETFGTFAHPVEKCSCPDCLAMTGRMSPEAARAGRLAKRLLDLLEEIHGGDVFRPDALPTFPKA